MRILEIEYPDELLSILNETEDSFQTLAREALVVKLYELGRLSSDPGAQMLGISHWKFVNLLGHYQVSLFDKAAGATLIEESRRA